ncbi:MAG TPA: GAF and ANTAR domain-containing protein [Cryptosporangiaceae bacterium]|nr:GAF and ANTAR domain-containing protein [Cryptosporangiaceae bacterium]
MTEPPLLDPMQAFAELGQINLAETDLPQVLTRVAELAKRTIPGAAEVSVSLLRGGTATTAAFTGEVAVQLDESQYEKGHGPCLAAADGGETMLIPDMAVEDRWPDYASDAVASGVHSSVSVGIPVQDAVTGALNIYATKPQSFDDDAIEMARTFAGYVGVALANAHLYSSTSALARQMEEAMKSRAVIEQAKGILVGQKGCTTEEAFDILIRASQSSNRKLRDIAESLVQNSQRPTQR